MEWLQKYLGVHLAMFLLRPPWPAKPAGKWSEQSSNIVFEQLGFSSNTASDTVAFTNFAKNIDFCGSLYFDSLVA
jgi:hypothetical protein